MRRRFLLIVNPGAGVAGSSLAVATGQALERAGAAVVRLQPDDLAAARRLAGQAARSDRYDAVVAAGGDGTIRHVAAALIGTDMPLGIVPVGTANVLAHEIGLVPQAPHVARMLLEGPMVKVSCASANGEPFLLMAGAGFDARVLAGLNHRIKSRMGKAAYAGPLLGALVSPMDVLTVTIDGRRHEASWAVIANARHYGGRFVMAPRTGIQERGLQAVLFKARSRAVLLGQLVSLALGSLDARAVERGDVEMLACAHVTITARHPVPTQIDGDLLGTTPLEIEAEAAEIRLIVPGGAPGIGNQPR
jgi:YegS/Rv2252/BmrU family lipid kinase